MKSLTLAAQAPTMSTMLFVFQSNSPMISEKKIASTASPSCLLIVLISGSLKIHLVSWVNIVGFRAGLFRLVDTLASTGFSSFFQNFSLGYFNVISDYLKNFQVVFSRIEMKIISGSLYFEQISPFNTSIPVLYCFNVVVHFTIEFTSVCSRCNALYFN